MFKLVLATALTISAPAYAEIPTLVETIQHEVNSTIKYKFEKPNRDFWKIPTTTGDCEDFALLKRQLLINVGWDESDLKIILLIETNDSTEKKVNVGHVVLYIESLDVILDMPNIKTPNVTVPLVISTNYYATENYRYLCTIGDISDKRFTNVSDRCDKTSFRRR